MKKVSKDIFFSKIGKLNVHPSILGDYPYTSIFRTPARIERGRIVKSFAIVDGRPHRGRVVSEYFLKD